MKKSISRIFSNLSFDIFWSILFGLITEVIQQLIPGRNVDIYDGIADTLGIIAGFYFYKYKQKTFDKMFLKIGA